MTNAEAVRAAAEAPIRDQRDILTKASAHDC